MTKSESILQALFAEVTSALPTFKVVRSRTASIGEVEMPLINIKPVTDEALNYAQNLTRQELIVEFELYVIPQDLPDTVLDVHMQNLHQTIINSVALQALVANVRYSGRQWQFQDADGNANKLTASYAFIYLNPNTSL